MDMNCTPAPIKAYSSSMLGGRPRCVEDCVGRRCAMVRRGPQHCMWLRFASSEYKCFQGTGCGTRRRPTESPALSCDNIGFHILERSIIVLFGLLWGLLASDSAMPCHIRSNCAPINADKIWPWRLSQQPSRPCRQPIVMQWLQTQLVRLGQRHHEP